MYMQDVAAAMILSEAVYKALDGSLQQAVEDVTSFLADLPQTLQQPLKLQWSLPHVNHRSSISADLLGPFSQQCRDPESIELRPSCCSSFQRSS